MPGKFSLRRSYRRVFRAAAIYEPADIARASANGALRAKDNFSLSNQNGRERRAVKKATD